MIRLFLLLLVFPLYADLSEHFKPAGEKSGAHGMKNIDLIYMINLDQRPEKFESSIKQLAPYGIFPFRFSAVNGWELSLETINDVGVKFEFWMTDNIKGTHYPMEGSKEPEHEIVQLLPGKIYFCHCMSRGAIGIALSHLSILQDAYDSGYETIWVMEDDIEIIRDPHVLSDLVERLDSIVGKEGWDVLFTDRDTKNSFGIYVPNTEYAKRPNYQPSNPGLSAERVDISPDFRKIGARFGAYSMIVRRSGMKKILNFFKNYNIFLPYDIDFTFPSGIRFFTVSHDVVSTQIKAPSDNGAPNYEPIPIF